MLVVRTSRVSRVKRLFCLTLAVVALVGLGVLPAYTWATSAQTPAPAATKIAYDVNGRIWLMNADGSDKTPITHASDVASNPAWSPDGQKIVYNCGGESDNICVMNADGSGSVELTGRGNFNPAWSPDGQKIAFTSYREGQPHIYLMNTDGSNQQRLFINDGNILAEDFPVWSPDGQKIAFAGSREDEDGLVSIHVVNADGSGVVNNVASGGVDLAWSPDGETFAYTDITTIYLVSAEGGGRSVFAGGDDSNTSPAFSPDGQRIAFTGTTPYADPATGETRNVPGLFAKNVSGSQLVNLDCPGCGHPAYKPAPLGNQAPIAQAKNVQAPAGADGTASVNAEDLNDGSTDPDGDTLSFSISPAGPFPVGANQVTLAVTDSRGASSTAQAVVTVVDVTAPVITQSPAPRTVPAGANCQATAPDLRGEVAATDNVTPSNALVVTQSPAAGAPLAVGGNNVTLLVADAAGNRSSVAAIVNVSGAGAPEVTASFTPRGFSGRRIGFFRANFAATATCGGSLPAVQGVMETPANAGAFQVVYERVGAGGLSEIRFDMRRGRVILRGQNETALRALLAQTLAGGGVRVANGQEMLLQLDNDSNGNDDYFFTFIGGRLVSVRGPVLSLKATATDAAGNVVVKTATPTFRN